MSDQTVKNRSEVRKEDTWAVEDIFATDRAWEEAYAEACKIPEGLAAYHGKLSDPEQLLAFFEQNDRAGLALSAIYNYACRKSDEDTAVSKYTDMVGKAYSLYVQVSAACAFSEPEIMAIPPELFEGFYRKVPALAHYKLAIDRILARRAHTLSEREERLLAMASELGRAPDEISSKLSDADLRYPDVDTPDGPRPLTQGSYAIFRTSQDREVRADAFRKLHNTHKAYENTYAAALDAQAKQLLFFSRARGYGSTLEASLSANEVPVEVYHNLIDTVHANMDKMYRYVALRKKLLGLDELHMYDLYAPIVAEADSSIPYEQAKATCLEALAPLGEKYCSVVKEGFDNRWIDVYENRGKRSGAYSAGARPHPFVLLNYTETLDSEFTLIHEMGHALHSYLSKEHQSTTYADYVIFVAEVASTCNEVLLMKHLLARTAEKRERAYLINYFLEQFRTTLYRQTMFAEFELQFNTLAEQGTTLTAQTLNEMYYALNRTYYGDGLVVDGEIAYEWSRIPHFYYDYYVFQYATGFSAAVALAQKILSEGESAAKAYLGFLSGGCSKDPISLLRDAGVDMATPQPIEQALNLFDELIDEMETLMSE